MDTEARALLTYLPYLLDCAQYSWLNMVIFPFYSIPFAASLLDRVITMYVFDIRFTRYELFYIHNTDSLFKLHFRS